MIHDHPWRRLLCVAAVLLAMSAGAALAQLQTGNLYGTVKDTDGAALPGVTVTLTGIGAPQVAVTNAQGEFRFLNLSPGAYQIVAELEGFSTVEYPNIDIRVGRNTTIAITLSPAVEDVITVTTESPLLDERKISTGTTVTSIELEKIPTARDPWAILNQTPGVLTDRINVGGNESGQQANFVGTGSNAFNNAFAVDGVVITDMAAVGASPTYYDFDAFEEVQVTTGGTDISLATGGVTLNLVTKRGTNEWQGSARYFLTDNDYQSTPGASQGDAGRNFNGPGDTLQVQDVSAFSANEIDRIQDRGLEVGGPILKDRLWIWGAYGKNDIRNLVGGGTLDATTLENYNAKINAQIVSANSAIFQFSRGDKIKNGRNAGPTRPPETTWDQSGPTEIWKLEDTHIFNPNFYLTGLYSFVDGGFALVPKGGDDADVFQDADGVYHGSFLDFSSDRNVDQWKVDGSYFFNSGKTSHELKFGTSFRSADTSSLTTWPKQRIVYDCQIFGCEEGSPPDLAGITLWRNRSVAFSTEYTAAWAQDTFTTNRWTVNAGLRYDAQDGKNGASAVPGVTIGGRDFFPDVDFGGNNGGGFTWETISPRVGVTYALGEDRKTLLRGNYSRFAEQLRQGYINRINPAAYTAAFAYFNDTNGDLVLQDSEVGSVDIFSYYGFDPANPVPVSPNEIDPNFKPSITDELRVGVEHAFLPEFVGGLDITYRKVNDLPELRTLIRDNGTVREATAADYELAGTVDGRLPTGDPFSVPFYDLREGLEPTGGTRLVTGDRGQTYLGASLTFTKRLSNKWMLRGNLTAYSWDWDIGPTFRAFDDPTDVLEVSNELDLGDDDGGTVAEQSEGSGGKGSIWQNSRWSFNINGMYQLPYGINIAANLNGREGYPNPLFANAQTSTGTKGVQITPEIDTFRNDSVYTVDVRVEKEFTINDFGLTLSLDGFNLLDANTVLQRQRSATSGSFDYITETLSPQIFRLGLRLRFH